MPGATAFSARMYDAADSLLDESGNHLSQLAGIRGASPLVFHYPDLGLRGSGS